MPDMERLRPRHVYTRPQEVVRSAVDTVRSHFGIIEAGQPIQLDAEGVLSIVPRFPFNFGQAFATDYHVTHPGSSRDKLPTTETVEAATAWALRTVVTYVEHGGAVS